MKNTYQKGDVVFVNLGDPPNEVVGREQGFERPCLVISAFNHLELAMIAPCTSKNKPYLAVTSVRVSAGTGGLTKDSMIMLHQMRSVSHDRIKKKVGVMPSEIMDKVDTVLVDIFDL